jgi:heme/copper-type cytochrome/quinol oxidase subunit 2
VFCTEKPLLPIGQVPPECCETSRSVWIEACRVSVAVILFPLLLSAGCGSGNGQQRSGRPQPVSTNGLEILPVPLDIEITGDEFEWHIRYPGADGRVGTADDIMALRHPHVPEYTHVRITLKSNDYLYSFAVPELNLKEIAVPELLFELEFETTSAGNFDLQGDQFCGFQHPNLSGQFIVQTRTQFLDWLSGMQNQSREGDGP